MDFLFVIVTSEECGHCRSFKDQHMTKLITKLKLVDGVSVLHINLPRSSTVGYFGNVNKNIFKFLKGPVLRINKKVEKAIDVFPQFFLFSMGDWLNDDADDKLRCLVFTRVLKEDGSTKPSGVNLPRTADSLVEWVKNGIKNYNVEVTENDKPEEVKVLKFISPSPIKLRVGPRFDD